MKFLEAYDEYIEAVERKALPAAIAVVRLLLGSLDESPVVNLGDGRQGGIVDVPLDAIRAACLSHGITFDDEKFEMFLDYLTKKVTGHSPNPTCYMWDIAHVLGHILTEEDSDTMH